MKRIIVLLLLFPICCFLFSSVVNVELGLGYGGGKAELNLYDIKESGFYPSVTFSLLNKTKNFGLYCSIGSLLKGNREVKYSASSLNDDDIFSLFGKELLRFHLKFRLGVLFERKLYDSGINYGVGLCIALGSEINDFSRNNKVLRLFYNTLGVGIKPFMLYNFANKCSFLVTFEEDFNFWRRENVGETYHDTIVTYAYSPSYFASVGIRYEI